MAILDKVDNIEIEPALIYNKIWPKIFLSQITFNLA